MQNNCGGEGDLTEFFTKPAAGEIIERIIDGEVFILLQERYKGNDRENGFIEIPAGKSASLPGRFKLSAAVFPVQSFIQSVPSDSSFCPSEEAHSPCLAAD